MGRLLLVVVGADSVASDYGGAQAPWRSNMARSGGSHCNARAGWASAIEEHRGLARVKPPFPEETDMRVSEVMTPGVRVVSPDQTISEAARLMAEIDVGSLPVGEDERLVGMITDRDIAVRAVAEQKPPTTKVREVMSQEVLYCFDDQDLDDIAQNMSDVKVRRLPVVDREKRLVGIVSIGDLAKSDNAASTGHVVADITAPGGAHSQRPGSKRKNAKRV